MPKKQLCLNPLLWFFLFVLPALCKGDPVLLSNEVLHRSIALRPFLTAVEDKDETFDATRLVKKPGYFTGLSTFHLAEPDNTFWLKTDIRTTKDLDQAFFCIHFRHLTFVDLYVFENGKLLSHRQAGAFQKQDKILPKDTRFNFQLKFLPGHHYTILFRVKHTKKYPPNYDFTLQSTYHYLADTGTLDSINAWFQGAIAILLFYSILSWFINRYRPFLWILLFLLGIGLYSISLQPIFIDFFFSNHPETGWLLVPPFLHMGIIGFYLLMMDFLDMKRQAPFLYKLGQYVICCMIAFSAFCVINNALTSNYYFTNQLNLSCSLVHFGFITYTLSVLWRKLDASQRFLVYGTWVFALGAIALVACSFLLKEKGLVYAPIIANSSIVVITILFLTGINQRLRQHEKEKIAVLEEMNTMHQQYSILVERKVKERTFELQEANQTMRTQQAALVAKKNEVEILMDELNHRVKNNLQMLYSLSTLQLPLMRHDKGKQVLNEMRGRVKAMMLVNGHLSQYREKQSVSAFLLVKEIVQHLQHIYDPNSKISIHIDIAERLPLPSSMSLSFGLILTELLTNTFKHAFTPQYVDPSIHIGITLHGLSMEFTYRDNGIGSEPLDGTSSMGISLIRDLTRQLKGQVSMEYQKGFFYRFILPNQS